jgi:hypothetical protein
MRLYSAVGGDAYSFHPSVLPEESLLPVVAVVVAAAAAAAAAASYIRNGRRETPSADLFAARLAMVGTLFTHSRTRSTDAADAVRIDVQTMILSHVGASLAGAIFVLLGKIESCWGKIESRWGDLRF